MSNLALLIAGSLISVVASWKLYIALMLVFDSQNTMPVPAGSAFLDAFAGAVYLILFRQFLISSKYELSRSASRMKESIDSALYFLFTRASKKDEDWWIAHYPGDRLISGSKRRVARPLFKESFEVWKAKLSARGFGPKSKSISPDLADAVFMEIRNAHDPSDPRLAEFADRAELEAKKNTDQNLRCFQFWELDGCLVELRLTKIGFIGKDGEWRPFRDIDDLLARGVPLSFNDAIAMGHIQPIILARDFLDIIRRAD